MSLSVSWSHYVSICLFELYHLYLILIRRTLVSLIKQSVELVESERNRDVPNVLESSLMRDPGKNKTVCVTWQLHRTKSICWWESFNYRRRKQTADSSDAIFRQFGDKSENILLNYYGNGSTPDITQKPELKFRSSGFVFLAQLTKPVELVMCRTQCKLVQTMALAHLHWVRRMKSATFELSFILRLHAR